MSIAPQQGCSTAKLETLTLSLLTIVEHYKPVRLSTRGATGTRQVKLQALNS